MGRLIDADELLARIRLNYNNHQNITAGAMKDIINTTKTAYDVEKVVVELEEYKQSHLIEHDSELCKHCQGMDCLETSEDCTICVMNKAIEIVKELEEEYKHEPYANYETVRSNRLDCEVPSDCFEQIKEVRVIDEWSEEYKVFRED